MLEMEPFIGLGLVNIIPDPSEFDIVLMKAIMDMARCRGHAKEINCDKDWRLHLRLSIEDFFNAISMMSTEVKIQTLIREFGVTEEMATETVVELNRHSELSPLMMLQPLNGGQFIQFRMGPNYEMALLVAQVTGSVLVTDSGSRWQELVSAQHREQGITSYPWNLAISRIGLIPIDYCFLEMYRKSQNHFATARNLMKAIDRMVLQNDQDAYKLTQLSSQATMFIDQLRQVVEPLVTTSLKVLSPEGGFYDTNVQRLLARSSCPKYDNKVRSIYGVDLRD